MECTVKQANNKSLIFVSDVLMILRMNLILVVYPELGKYSCCCLNIMFQTCTIICNILYGCFLARCSDNATVFFNHVLQ